MLKCLQKQVVRVAPNELSYVHEDAWRDVYGSHKDGELKKHVIADPANLHHVFATPSDEIHARLRKKISPAFSEKNVRDREFMIQESIDLLIKILRESAGKSIDILTWYQCTTLDIIGKFAFGESFQCL